MVPDGSYAAFVEQRAADALRPGPIVDRHGNVLAKHDGIHRFTIGQRKGIGVAVGRPVFVARIDAASATSAHASRARQPASESREWPPPPTSQDRA